jgi:uracil-DNA glycosylase family 4
MLPKPDACKGCPYYQTGVGFVPDEVRAGSSVFVLGQNPGAEEEAQGLPFIGKTGQMMERSFFPLAGVSRDSISIGNAIRCRLNKSNELPPLDTIECRTAVQHCTRAHLRIPEGTQLVIAQGEKALYAATGHGAQKNDRISDWRGWVLPLRPVGVTAQPVGIYNPKPGETAVLATYHLAAAFREPKLQHPMKYDWSRAARFLAGTWPEPMPPIDFDPPESWPVIAAFDTEYVRETRELIRFQLAWRDVHDEPIVHVVEAKDMPPTIQGAPNWYTLIMHNTEADQAYLDRLIREYRIEDTMHAHAVLWSDFEHTLEFLGSLYGRINRWKPLASVSPLIYAGADALVTYDVWQALQDEFLRDVQSYDVYKNFQMPLIPIIRKAQQYGLRVNQEHARFALADLASRVEDAEAQAQAAVGWPINLGSGPQVMEQLYRHEQVHSALRRRRA